MRNSYENFTSTYERYVYNYFLLFTLLCYNNI